MALYQELEFKSWLDDLIRDTKRQGRAPAAGRGCRHYPGGNPLRHRVEQAT